MGEDPGHTHTGFHKRGWGPWNLSVMRLSQVAGAEKTENDQEWKGMGWGMVSTV